MSEDLRRFILSTEVLKEISEIMFENLSEEEFLTVFKIFKENQKFNSLIDILETKYTKEHVQPITKNVSNGELEKYFNITLKSGDEIDRAIWRYNFKKNLELLENTPLRYYEKIYDIKHYDGKVKKSYGLSLGEASSNYEKAQEICQDFENIY